MPKNTFFNLSQEKRELIENVAIAEFADNSLQSASVNAIVNNAGIAKGSFYQYFENLEDLYNHILTLVHDRKLELTSTLPLPANNLDTFRYLQRLLQIDLAFELKHPLLSRVERRHNFENPVTSSIDPETGQRLSGDGRFHAFLSQGILHDDIATWVDTDLAAYVLGIVSRWLSPYLLERMEQDSGRPVDVNLDVSHDPHLQDLLQNLMDILMAGMARDPQIRKDFYSK
ncbi:MAG: TetR/AcrR family transcriptional regulator [Anaerolineaceae bacterium]|jgi:AcrR family transcriptional regulator|nr:TetR/AcrR family transcriptional regulator [Anaerolineaceae bacterium]MDD4043106.1 TetR/AcrR family transcriptional regulator [Anaerolineaceae bacterium]MDD4576982.1 TetR/AcrR family transcriptional regulator [Anaerolineaceae bacterium]